MAAWASTPPKACAGIFTAEGALQSWPPRLLPFERSSSPGRHFCDKPLSMDSKARSTRVSLVGYPTRQAARVKQLSCRKPSPTDGFPHANQSLTEGHVPLPFRIGSRRKGLSAEFRRCITLLMEETVVRLLLQLRDLAQPCLFDPEVADAEHVYVRVFDQQIGGSKFTFRI